MPFWVRAARSATMTGFCALTRSFAVSRNAFGSAWGGDDGMYFGV